MYKEQCLLLDIYYINAQPCRFKILLNEGLMFGVLLKYF